MNDMKDGFSTGDRVCNGVLEDEQEVESLLYKNDHIASGDSLEENNSGN